MKIEEGKGKIKGGTGRFKERRVMSEKRQISYKYRKENKNEKEDVQENRR